MTILSQRLIPGPICPQCGKPWSEHYPARCVAANKSKPSITPADISKATAVALCLLSVFANNAIATPTIEARPMRRAPDIFQPEDRGRPENTRAGGSWAKAGECSPTKAQWCPNPKRGSAESTLSGGRR